MRTTGKQAADGTNPEVDHPEHYNQHPSGVECIEVVRHMGFNLGNVVKYLWRDGLKDTEVPLQDLEKACWYLKDEIDRRKSETTVPVNELVRTTALIRCRKLHDLPMNRAWSCKNCEDAIRAELIP